MFLFYFSDLSNLGNLSLVILVILEALVILAILTILVILWYLQVCMAYMDKILKTYNNNNISVATSPLALR